MLNVGNASIRCVRSMVDRQLCTFTLKRNGPFGDEHVPGTYAFPFLTVIDSSRFGNAAVGLSSGIGQNLPAASALGTVGKEGLRRAVLGGALGLLLTVFYAVPAIGDAKRVNVDFSDMWRR